jgi:uncharacterized damage-inducible protein DinB
MKGYGAADLARSFRTVRKNTIKVAEDIPADRYDFRASPDVRSVAEMLAHIAVAPRFPRRVHGQRVSFIEFSTFTAERQRRDQEESALRSKDAILEELRRGGEEFAAWLESLPEEVLCERVGFPPPVEPSSKTRFEMLLAVKEHEMHHRGQLMLTERLLGIVPHLTRELAARRAQMAQQAAHP